jgi:hypothetical protein
MCSLYRARRHPRRLRHPPPRRCAQQQIYFAEYAYASTAVGDYADGAAVSDYASTVASTAASSAAKGCPLDSGSPLKYDVR